MNNNEIDEEIKNFLFRISAEIVNEAQDVAPVRTQNLQNDIQVFDDEIEDGFIKVGNSNITKYAKFVHNGTSKQSANRYLKKGLDNYVDSSTGLDRAINELGSNVRNVIEDDLRRTIRDMNI